MAVEQHTIADFVDAVGHVDVFICCASYEERSLSLARALSKRQQPECVWLVQHADLHDQVSHNAQEVIDLFGPRVKHITARTDRPLDIADHMQQALLTLPEADGRTLLVDITTFTHESLLILLRLLEMHRSRFSKALFCYCSASDYDPGVEDKDKWLSKGVYRVRSVLGYPGHISPSKPNHLLVLVGYEYERASSLIEVFEPAKVSLGKGQSAGERHLEAGRRFDLLKEECMSRCPSVEEFEFSCHDSFECKSDLLEQIHMSPDYNAIIAPLNTKISTVGCALAAMSEPSIQLCYAQALQYNCANYSSPRDNCYSFRLPELSAGA
jgi:hypothetical protein